MGSYPSNQGGYSYENNENEFNDFEEDEMTRKIREEEERIQNTLRDKSVLLQLVSKKSMSKRQLAKQKAAVSYQNS